MKHHHALLIATIDFSHAALATAVGESLGDLGEVDEVTSDRLTIGAVHELVRQVQLAPRVGTSRWVIIRAPRFTPDAQHALLKLLEEPPAHVTLVLATTYPESLLPTVRSRLQELVVSSDHERELTTEEVFSSWLALPVAARLEEVAKRTKAKDQPWIEALAFGLRRHAGVRSLGPEARRGVALVLQHLQQPGASSKLLLEELALTLPAPR